jgi:hypothetical protein
MQVSLNCYVPKRQATERELITSIIVKMVHKAVPWFRRLVTGLSPRRLCFNSGVSPCEICGGQSGTGTDFSPSTSVSSCQFHSTGSPLHGKTKKKLIIYHSVT